MSEHGAAKYRVFCWRAALLLAGLVGVASGATVHTVSRGAGAWQAHRGAQDAAACPLV